MQLQCRQQRGPYCTQGITSLYLPYTRHSHISLRHTMHGHDAVSASHSATGLSCARATQANLPSCLCSKRLWSRDQSDTEKAKCTAWSLVVLLLCWQSHDIAAVLQNFWTRLASKYGNKFYWQEKGQGEAITNAVRVPGHISAAYQCLHQSLLATH